MIDMGMDRLLKAIDEKDAGPDPQKHPLSFRPSRTCYPGSKFGPKSRYDLPTRIKSYSGGDEADAILFSGTSLQPRTWASTTVGSTPRSGAVFGEAARSLFHPLADKNLPELPLHAHATEDTTHGVVVLGGKGCGKTSLIFSLMASMTGKYSSRRDTEEHRKRNSMPAYGQHYELGERDIMMMDGITEKTMKVVLTDTPPCGTNKEEEQPLCAAVTPNSTQHCNAIPSWMRITMRASVPHYTALFVIDSMSDPPLWEDERRCRDLARLLAVLRRSQYTVVLAVTKLLSLRKEAIRNVNHGHPHRDVVGKDPRTSYEAFVGRYIEKVSSSIQAKALESNWTMSQGPDCPAFPLMNSTIFDAPTWNTTREFNDAMERKGCAEQPTFKYCMKQLDRILKALSRLSLPQA